MSVVVSRSTEAVLLPWWREITVIVSVAVATALAMAVFLFVLGRQLLPGHYDAASLALLHAGSLREALTLLVQCQARLCPLLAPRLVADDKLAVLSWTEACGLGWLKATVGESFNLVLLAVVLTILAGGVVSSLIADRLDARRT